MKRALIAAAAGSLLLAATPAQEAVPAFTAIAVDIKNLYCNEEQRTQIQVIWFTGDPLATPPGEVAHISGNKINVETCDIRIFLPITDPGSYPTWPAAVFWFKNRFGGDAVPVPRTKARDSIPS